MLLILYTHLATFYINTYLNTILFQNIYKHLLFTKLKTASQFYVFMLLLYTHLATFYINTYSNTFLCQNIYKNLLFTIIKTAPQFFKFILLLYIMYMYADCYYLFGIKSMICVISLLLFLLCNRIPIVTYIQKSCSQCNFKIQNSIVVII